MRLIDFNFFGSNLAAQPTPCSLQPNLATITICISASVSLTAQPFLNQIASFFAAPATRAGHHRLLFCL